MGIEKKITSRVASKTDRPSVKITIANPARDTNNAIKIIFQFILEKWYDLVINRFCLLNLKSLGGGNLQWKNRFFLTEVML